VPTLPIVEHLDVFEDVLLGFLSDDILSLVYQLTFERPEEAFNARVVTAIAFAGGIATVVLLKHWISRRDSFAKNAAARFKKSRSCFKVAFSRLNWASTSCPARIDWRVWPGVRPVAARPAS
jgi:hypothetical protein